MEGPGLSGPSPPPFLQLQSVAHGSEGSLLQLLLLPQSHTFLETFPLCVLSVSLQAPGSGSLLPSLWAGRREGHRRPQTWPCLPSLHVAHPGAAASRPQPLLTLGRTPSRPCVGSECVLAVLRAAVLVGAEGGAGNWSLAAAMGFHPVPCRRATPTWPYSHLDTWVWSALVPLSLARGWDL